MKPLPALSAIAAMLLLLSGCGAPPTTESTTSTTPAPEPDPVWPAVQAAMEGVPCEAEVGGADSSSQNLKLLSTVPVEEGRLGELDLRGDLTLHARKGAGGFEVYDVRDPLSPQRIGNNTDIPDGLDVKFGPDNVTVFVGTGDGITIVDLSDPTAPQVTGELAWSDIPGPPAGPAPGLFLNAHMIYTKRIAQKDWLFLAPNTGTGVWIFEIGGVPGNRTLTYVTQTAPVEGGPLGPHDMYVQKDELDGHWYLYSADGFHGWTAFNVDNPAKPMVAGGWINPAEASYTHTIQAKVVDGRRIVATIGEIGGNLLRIYDATVLAAPMLLAAWQAPESRASPEHNFNIVGDKLYLAYYTHGLYVFNLTHALPAGLGVPVAGTAFLKPIAHWAVKGEGQGGPLDFAGYWDVVLKDGIVYVGHIEGGLVVLGFGCNPVPDARLTSDG